MSFVPWQSPDWDPGDSDGKESACNVGDLGSIPALGRSPGRGHSNPLQDSCLENPRDRGAWWAYSPSGCKESDMTERLSTLSKSCVPYTVWFSRVTQVGQAPWGSSEFCFKRWFEEKNICIYIHKIIMKISLRIDTHFKDLTLRLPESMSGTHGIWSFLEKLQEFWSFLENVALLRVAEKMLRRHSVKTMPGARVPMAESWEAISSVPSSEPQCPSENRGATLANRTGRGRSTPGVTLDSGARVCRREPHGRQSACPRPRQGQCQARLDLFFNK